MIVAERRDILSLFDLFRVNTKTTSEMTEKLACRETRGPVLTSQSFLVSRFRLRGFAPHRKLQTRGRKIVIENFFSLFLSEHYVDSMKQIKKISHIHFKFISYGIPFLNVAEEATVTKEEKSNIGNWFPPLTQYSCLHVNRQTHTEIHIHRNCNTAAEVSRKCSNLLFAAAVVRKIMIWKGGRGCIYRFLLYQYETNWNTWVRSCE